MTTHAFDRRPDTGVTSVALGMWLFLASEVMLFGALFSALALFRASSPNWPDGRDVLSLTFALSHTLVLQGITACAWRARALVDAGTARRWLGAASALAVVFLAAKGIEYRDEVRLGLLPRLNTFLAMYFVLTGLHAVHVAGGLIANLWAMAGATRVDRARFRERVRALFRYWAFVDLVWLAILIGVYLT